MQKPFSWQLKGTSVMATKNGAVKKRLVSLIEKILASEPDLVIERDGHKYVALQTVDWLDLLGGEICERTFRSWISKPPFVRRTYEVDYERTLCLRLGEDVQSTLDHAKALSRAYYRAVPRKPGGYLSPGDFDYDKHAEPTKTGWKAPDRRDLIGSFVKLVDLWGDEAPAIFQFTLDRWLEFLASCEGVDRKLKYPSVRTILRHEKTARTLWKLHQKAVATAKKMAHKKSLAA